MKVENEIIKLQIWDTAGQDRFHTITQTYYKQAKGIILIYDCTDINTKDNIDNWLNQITDNCNPESTVVILVCNKIDLEDERKIPE